MTIPLIAGQASVLTIIWQAETPPNTQIKVEISRDKGASWESVTQNASIIFTTQEDATQIFLLRTTLETTSPAYTPKLLKLSVFLSHGATLYQLTADVFTDAGLSPSEYWIDPELSSYVIPYAWLRRGSHYEALTQIIKACLGQCHVTRNNVIQVHVTRQPNIPIRLSDSQYFQAETETDADLINDIEVAIHPLVPADAYQVVYRSPHPESIQAGETKTLSVFFEHTPVMDCSAYLKDALAGIIITEAQFYAWGAKITVASDVNGTFILLVQGKPLFVRDKSVFLASDAASIDLNGDFIYKFPISNLVQTQEFAQKITDNLLSKYNEPSETLKICYRGNPAWEIDDTIAFNGTDYRITTNELIYEDGLIGKITGRK